MPRIKLELSKKKIKTINNFLNSIVTLSGSELDIFNERFIPFFMSEYKTLKEYQNAFENLEIYNQKLKELVQLRNTFGYLAR